MNKVDGLFNYIDLIGIECDVRPSILDGREKEWAIFMVHNEIAVEVSHLGVFQSREDGLKAIYNAKRNLEHIVREYQMGV